MPRIRLRIVVQQTMPTRRAAALIAILATNAWAANVTTAIVKFDCRDVLAKIKGAAGQHDANAILDKQLAGLNLATQKNWINRNVNPALIRSMEQSINLAEFLSGKNAKAGESVFWLQQGGLKELNERLWSMGGTEYFLKTLDEQLDSILRENPKLGRVIHNNYKDRVVVSALSEADFKKRVMDPLFKRVAKKVADSHSTDIAKTEPAWNIWLRSQTAIGSGKTLLEAHLAKLGLQEPGVFQFRVAILKINQTRLSYSLKGANASFEELFTAMKAADNDPAKIAAWFVSKGIAPESAARLSENALVYKKSLDVADFLPLAHSPTIEQVTWAKKALVRLKRGQDLSNEDRTKVSQFVQNSWTAQQTAFLSKTLDAGAIVAADFKGLGLQGLKARHEWFLAGADPAKIETIYSGITQDLANRVNTIKDQIIRITGTAEGVNFYQSGDDLLIALPKVGSDGPPKITPAQYDQVLNWLKARTDLYSQGEKIAETGNAKSIAETIRNVRKAMFNSKPGG